MLRSRTIPPNLDAPLTGDLTPQPPDENASGSPEPTSSTLATVGSEAVTPHLSTDTDTGAVNNRSGYIAGHAGAGLGMWVPLQVTVQPGAHRAATIKGANRLSVAILKALEHHYMQLIILALVIIDLMAVFGELMLVEVCGEGEHAIHTWETVLHWLSLTILSIFALQQLVLLCCLRRQYFKHWFYMIDFIVVVVAIVLEVAVKVEAGGLLAVVLGWRIVRVVHGFVVSAEAEEHDRHVALQKYWKAKKLVNIAGSYTATQLRLATFKLSARIIQRWWRAHTDGGRRVAAVDARDVNASVKSESFSR